MSFENIHNIHYLWVFQKNIIHFLFKFGLIVLFHFNRGNEYLGKLIWENYTRNPTRTLMFSELYFTYNTKLFVYGLGVMKLHIFCRQKHEKRMKNQSKIQKNISYKDLLLFATSILIFALILSRISRFLDTIVDKGRPVSAIFHFPVTTILSQK